MTFKILIVDDNPTNLQLACDLLEYEGYQVEKAGNAEYAQEILKISIPDLILMDIALPQMDGLTFTRQLKSDERFKHIPVVALTAFAMKGDDQKAYNAGCNGYITKPINTRTLAEQVKTYLTAKPKAN